MCSDSDSRPANQSRPAGQVGLLTVAVPGVPLPCITDEGIRHALRNFIAVAADPRDDDVTLFLGPDRAVNLIEVGVLDTDDGPLIIHAMAARTGRFQSPKE